MSVAVEVMTEMPVTNGHENKLPHIITQAYQLSPLRQKAIIEAVIAQGALWPEEEDPAQTNDALDAELKVLLLQTRQLSLREKHRLIEVLTGHGFEAPETWFKSRVTRTNKPFIDRTREMNWIQQHGNDYAGQFIAVSGDQLVAHGTRAREIYTKAREHQAIVYYVEKNPDLPYVAL